MGLADFLSPILNVATQAAGTYQHAQDQAGQQKIQQVVNAVRMKQQQQEQAIKDALIKAQTGEAQAKTALTQHEASVPRLGDPGYAQAMGDVSGAQAAAQWPTKERELRAQLNNSLAVEQARGATAMQIAAMRIQGEKEINAAKIAAAVKAKAGAGGGTPAQELAGAQYQVAKDAAPGIDEYNPGIASKVITHIPLVGNKILGWVDPDYQQLDRDSRQFIEAYMHAQGGRRVAQAEYDRLKGIYIPTPGDNERTRQRKIAARQTALQSMHRMAGPVGDQVDRDMSQGVQLPVGGGASNPFDDLVPGN